MIYQDNIFTDIANNPQKTQWICNTNHTIAFYDINPQAPIHILIIPKNKYTNYSDFLSHSTLEEREDFNNVIKDLIQQFKLEDKGFNIKINTNESHGQIIMHYHMHLLS